MCVYTSTHCCFGEIDIALHFGRDATLTLDTRMNTIRRVDCCERLRRRSSKVALLGHFYARQLSHLVQHVADSLARRKA